MNFFYENMFSILLKMQILFRPQFFNTDQNLFPSQKMFPSPPAFLIKSLFFLSFSMLFLLSFQLAIFLANLRLLTKEKCGQNANLDEANSMELVEMESKRIVEEDGKNDEFIAFMENEEKLAQNEAKWGPDLRRSHPLQNSCKFPLLEPTEPNLLPFVRHFRQVNCPPPPVGHLPLVSQLPGGQILVGIPHRSKLPSDVKIQCFGRQLGGTLRPKIRRVEMLGNWTLIPMNRIIQMPWEQFAVKCFKSGHQNEKELVFHDAFANILPLTKLMPSSIPEFSRPPLRYGISLFVIDSTAQSQFQRHMPLCREFLRKNGFQLMNGYTKIGDNSAINLLAILAGMVFQPIERGFNKDWFRNSTILGEQRIRNNQSDFWQTLPSSLFRLAKMGGYSTLWNDEIATSGYGLFHYNNFKGFLRSPADHYFRPFYEYIYQRLGARSGCLNGQFAAPRFIQIWEKFCTVYSGQPKLALNFLTGLTHASANNLELLDGPLVDALGRLKDNGLFERDFVILMGDHGQRISQIQRTHSGRIEERMPLLAIKVPEEFVKKWPQKVGTLIENQNRLISNFDLFQMLADILYISAEQNEDEEWMDAIERAKNNRPGQSLFTAIPTNRNCADARIPHQFCCCMEQINPTGIANWNGVAQNLPNLLHSHLIAHLRNFSTSPSNCLQHFHIEEEFNQSTANLRIYRLNEQARAGVRSPANLQKLKAQNGENGWKIEENLLEAEIEAKLTKGPIELKILARIGIHLENSGPKLLMRGTPLVLGWTPPILGACKDGAEAKRGNHQNDAILTLGQFCECIK